MAFLWGVFSVLAAAAMAEAPSRLTVASFNLYCFQEDEGKHVMPFAERAEHIARYIVESGIDVIGFQEVCAPLTGGPTSLDHLLRLVRERSGDSRYTAYFAETHTAWGAYREGIGIITRLGVKAAEERALGSLAEFFPRKALAARLESPLGQLRFIVTHLTAVWGDPGRRGELSRAREATALKEFAHEGQGETAVTVVVGDFNSSPGDEPSRKMMSEEAGMAFRDGLPAVGGTIPSWAPGERIDQIFFFGPVRVATARKIFSEPVAGKFFSDHVGVESRLERLAP